MKTSVAGTEYMLGIARAHLVNLREALARTEAATELKVTLNYSVKNGYKRDTLQQDVVVKQTDSYTTENNGYIIEGILKVTLPNGEVRHVSFNETKKSQMWNLNRAIDSTEEDIAFFQRKIAEYKP